MPNELIVGLVIGFLLVVGAIAVVTRAPRLGVPIRILALVVFVLVACFCAFGFAASFEPGDFHVVWRVLYAVVFVACVAGSIRLLLPKNDISDVTPD